MKPHANPPTESGEVRAVAVLVLLVGAALAIIFTSPVWAGPERRGGGIITTNTPSAGQVLHSDGVIYYWNDASASATNAQRPHTGLTNITDQVSANGLLTRTSTNNYTARSIAASGSGVSVANGDGVSGNPTVSLSTTLQNLDGTGAATNLNSTQFAGTTIRSIKDQASMSNLFAREKLFVDETLQWTNRSAATSNRQWYFNTTTATFHGGQMDDAGNAGLNEWLQVERDGLEPIWMRFRGRVDVTSNLVAESNVDVAKAATAQSLTVSNFQNLRAGLVADVDYAACNTTSIRTNEGTRQTINLGANTNLTGGLVGLSDGVEILLKVMQSSAGAKTLTIAGVGEIFEVNTNASAITYLVFDNQGGTTNVSSSHPSIRLTSYMQKGDILASDGTNFTRVNLGTGKIPMGTNANHVTGVAAVDIPSGGGGGASTFNEVQFEPTANGTNIKSGAMLTNPIVQNSLRVSNGWTYIGGRQTNADNIIPAVDNFVELGASTRRFYTLRLMDGGLELHDGPGTKFVRVAVPATLDETWTWTIPPNNGNPSSVLTNDGAGGSGWQGISSLQRDTWPAFLHENGSGSAMRSRRGMIHFVDEFLAGNTTANIGDTRWASLQQAQGGSVVDNTAHLTNHHGAVTVFVRSTNTGAYSTFLKASGASAGGYTFLGATNFWEAEINLTQVPGVTSNGVFQPFAVTAGFLDTSTAIAQTDAVFFLGDTNVSTWQCVSYAAGAATTNSTSIDVTNLWTRLGIEYRPATTSVVFYVNGTAAVTNNNSNVPTTGACNLGFQIFSRNTDAERRADYSIDYVETWGFPIVPR